MRKQMSSELRLAVFGFMVAASSAINVAAQDSAKATTTLTNTETATASQTAPVQLSVASWDVLKLVRSKIGDGTIIAFISNSNKAYSLGAPEIIYLREQGASEGVITAMLNQRGTAPVPTAPAATQWVAPSPPSPPSPTYVAPAPAYVQPSPVYVAAPAPAYSYSYPYCGSPYYGSFWPSAALSFGVGFGFGSYYGHGGHYGHGGGGYHGGGGGGHGGHH